MREKIKSFFWAISFSDLRHGILDLLSQLLFYFSLLAFVVLLYDVGFEYDAAIEDSLHTFNSYSLIIFFVILTIRFLLFAQRREDQNIRMAEYILLGVLLGGLIFRFLLRDTLLSENSFIAFFNQKVFAQLIVLYVFIVELSKKSLKIYRLKFNPALLFVFSFAVLIIAGMGLLLLPRATENGISLIDAFFTATSAVCVTGLITVDTATAFTTFGRTIILILIQLGGLGIMTFTSFFVLFFQSGTSLRHQLFLKDVMNEERLGKTLQTLASIIVFTLLIEFIGAACIFLSVDEQVFPNLNQRIRFSVFHSISAFCNAGFSTLTDGLYDIRIRYNYTLQLFISGLIIMGGLGFPIIFNFYRYLRHHSMNARSHVFKRQEYRHTPRLISGNSRIVLVTTLVLLIAGTILFGIAEYHHALREHTPYGKVITAFFGAVTPRTAGFNTFDTTTLTAPTILIYLLLMWIGASPASTGGGIKTSTFAVAFLNCFSIAKGQNRIEAFRREILRESVQRAFAVIFLSFMIIGLAVFLITLFDPDKELVRVAFECFSAYSTVGLSMGLTGNLSTASKVVLIATMFIGRVGALTLMVSFFQKVKDFHYRYPSETIIIN